MNYGQIKDKIRDIVADPAMVLFTNQQIADALAATVPMVMALPRIGMYWGKTMQLTQVGTGQMGGLTWYVYQKPDRLHSYYSLFTLDGSDKKHQVILASPKRAWHIAKGGVRVAFLKEGKIWRYPADAEVLYAIALIAPPDYEPGVNEDEEIKLGEAYLNYWIRCAAANLMLYVREKTTEDAQLEFYKALGALVSVFRSLL